MPRGTELAVTPLTCSVAVRGTPSARSLKARAPSVRAALEAADGDIGALKPGIPVLAREVKDIGRGGDTKPGKDARRGAGCSG